MNYQNEIWKPVEGYEGYYEVSNFARIRSVDRIHIKKNNEKCFYKGVVRKQALRDGYWVCSFSKNNKVKTHIVHRFLCKAFMENPQNKPFVNHKNGIRSDNRLENLEWVTHRENIQHCFTVLKRSTNRKGVYNDPSISRKIKCETLDLCFDSISDARRVLGVANIGRMLAGKRKHCEGLTFRYL